MPLAHAPTAKPWENVGSRHYRGLPKGSGEDADARHAPEVAESSHCPADVRDSLSCPEPNVSADTGAFSPGDADDLLRRSRFKCFSCLKSPWRTVAIPRSRVSFTAHQTSSYAAPHRLRWSTPLGDRNEAQQASLKSSDSPSSSRAGRAATPQADFTDRAARSARDRIVGHVRTSYCLCDGGQVASCRCSLSPERA